MDGDNVIWIVIAICFIIIISISIYNFVRIGNLQNSTTELEISLKNESQSNVENNNSNLMSNISQVKLELEADIRSNIENIKNEQLSIDSNQNALILKNKGDIFDVHSNITNVIQPKLSDFDGNFKSLEGAVLSNKGDIDTVSKSITQLSSQFDTQYSQLSNDIKKINESQFEDKISKLKDAQSKIQSELTGINVNKQSIANNKVKLEATDKKIKDVVDDIGDMSGDFMTLAGSTLQMANIVDNHDLIVKSL